MVVRINTLEDKKKPALVVFVVLIVSLTFLSGVLYIFNSQGSVTKVVNVQKSAGGSDKRVFVASRNLSYGELITKYDLREKNVSSAVVEGALQRPSILDQGYEITVPAGKGDIIYSHYLRKRERKPETVKDIPPGMRLLSIAVNATSAVDGWAAAGAKVDVIHIMSNKISSLVANVIAENISIYSVNRSRDGVLYEQSPSIVTLILSTDQVMPVRAASASGRIKLALRGDSESMDYWSDTDYTSTELMSGLSEISVTDSSKVSVGGVKYILTNGSQWIAVHN